MQVPAEPGTNQSRIPCLPCCWKEIVFQNVLKWKACPSFLYSTQHVASLGDYSINAFIHIYLALENFPLGNSLYCVHHVSQPPSF